MDRKSLLDELLKKFPEGPRWEALQRVSEEVFGPNFDGNLENLSKEELEELKRVVLRRIPNTPDAIFTGSV